MLISRARDPGWANSHVNDAQWADIKMPRGVQSASCALDVESKMAMTGNHEL